MMNIPNKTTQRDLNLDVLRIAAAFAVVWLHVAAPIVSNGLDVHSTRWWIGNIADALSRWCVPIFVMVSGALLLTRNAPADPIEFYKKRLTRLLVPIVFWTIFYLALSAFKAGHFDTQTAMWRVIKGVPYFHLWYLYMLLGLLLVTPFLRLLVTVSSRRTLLIFIFVCFGISCTETIFNRGLDTGGSTFAVLFLPFLGYYTVGHFLHTCSPAGRFRGLPLLLVGVAFGMSIGLGTGLFLPSKGARAIEMMYSYLNPLCVLMSLCVYRYFTGLSIVSPTSEKIIGFLAPLTFGIYLIHPIWLEAFNALGINRLLIHPAIGIPLVSVAALALSILSTALIARIPYVRATIR